MKSPVKRRGDFRITPINVDRNVSPKEVLRNMIRQNDGRMVSTHDFALVHSTFMTIQGEGPYAGHQAVFIRLGGCNLGAKFDCTWCDTAFQTEQSTLREVDWLLNVCLSSFGEYWNDRLKVVVITGGEPLMQGEAIRELIADLHRHSPTFRVQIETNGYYLSKFPDLAPYCVVSPKASTQGQSYSRMIYDPANNGVMNNAMAVKFLLSADPESLYHELPDYWQSYKPVVYVSPIAEYLRSPTREEGEVSSGWDDTMIDQDRTRGNYAYASKYVSERCKEPKALLISLQQHLFYGLP